LHRYLTADESPEVKAAVVAALTRTRGDYARVLAELLTTEPDALVRVGMVSSLRRVPGPDAIAAIEVALADADPQVRETAANIAGRHPEGASLAAPLIDALDDLPAIQLAAARSLGYLRVPSATAALTGLLASADADLRLASLQAIDRIDPELAEGLSQLATLTADPDPKVARAAQKIAAR
ncbi:MAG TPA: HEAT repeat domain-containing protein, partial [Enhygromyxa sp.]|nr:HEAT repeat domain-containing protein [Enhygromyxa sp.]